MITLDKYVIMPNHIHMLLLIQKADGSALRSSAISTIVNQLKGYVTKQIGKPIWQRSFYDHVVRDEHDYEAIWRYIDENPLKWDLDCNYL